MINVNGQALAELRRRFGVWRHRRSRGTRIPEELWQAAAQAARAHGVCRISRHLGVDYYALNQRLMCPAPGRDPIGVKIVENPRQVQRSDRPACWSSRSSQGGAGLQGRGSFG